MSDKNKNDILRELTGNVTINCKLTSFIYSLLRDHLPAGEVELLIREAEDQSNVTYTNGYLAKYSEILAKRLLDE